jgi:ectoine hydroxylase-related dioxygenase (phytanoyl-CoA dioxygenase family)
MAPAESTPGPGPIGGQDAHYRPYVQAQQEARQQGRGPIDAVTLWSQCASHQNSLFRGHRQCSGADIGSYSACRGNIGSEGLGWQRAADEAALTTPQLVASRAYARDLEVHDLEEVISACSLSIRRYGFCCVDHVIPREEVARAKWEVSDGHEQQIAALGQQRPRSEIVLQPTFARYLCHPTIVGIAQTMLDAHVRIANVGHRNLPSDEQAPHGIGGFEVGPKENRGRHGREWHTDWPHDLSDRGPHAQGGPIRQPFPDVCMSLSMVWYMVDVGPDSGATYCVPGSHRDTRNPRGPHDNICVSAPIPGEMQVSCPAGSVYIQDSRCWHSTACHNTSGHVRVAAQNRWTPYWLNGALGGGALTAQEWGALPAGLQPLLRHQCAELEDLACDAKRLRGEAADAQNTWGFSRAGEEGLESANAHIVVRVAKL